MEVVTIEDARILLPDINHKSFRHSAHVIPEGTLVHGNIRIVEGLKRGQPFKYNLFYTDDNKIIFIKHIKPMKTTEVQLGADSAQTSTNITLPGVSNLGKRPVIGAFVGAAAAFGIAKYRKVTGNHKLIVYAAIGAVVGFIAGKYLQSKTKVSVKPSK